MFNRGRTGGGLDLDFAYLGENINTANQNSYTFSGVSIGDAHPDRMVVVCFSINTEAVASQGGSVTIGGIAATVITDSGMFGSAGIAYAKISSGSTADIIVTRTNTGNTPSQCSIARYRLNTRNSSPLDSGAIKSTGFGVTTLTVADIECVDDGVVIIAANAGNVTGSITWNGVDSFSSDVNALTESKRRIFGKVLPTENSSIRDVTLNISGATPCRLNAASFSLD